MDVSYIVDSAWDNNGVEQLFMDENSVYCYHTDSLATRKAGAMDMFGNLSQCTAKVTVLDTISPIPMCRDTTVSLVAAGTVTIDSSYVDMGSTDNCDVSTITISRNSFTCMDVGPNIIDVTVCDAHSNTSECQVTVTVLDTTPPLAACMDTTVYLDASGNVSIDSSFCNNGSADNCGISSMLLSNDSFTCGDIGSNSVSITIVDASGNNSVCVVQVTVLDTVGPALTCTDTTVYLDNTGSVTIDSAFVIQDKSDNCGLSHALLSRSEFNTADLTSAQAVSVTLYDGSGNASTCNALVTVLDTISTGLEKQIPCDDNFEFNVIPNPSGGFFRIESKTPVDDCILEIYNFKGALLFTRLIPGGKAEIDISEFGHGVYILKVTGMKDREYRQRLIIH
jgi:hypothetical protein